MSKEAERFLEKIGSQNPYNLYKGERKPLSEVLQAYADERNKERDIKLIKFIYEETCQLREMNSEPTDMDVFAKSMLKHFQTLNK